ncbi:MAG TPA: hypothetical protein VLM17_05795 [Xanthomonadaceae bacterium]|nr:hypothetical protein [Xanthomonadaceae bacterium]
MRKWGITSVVVALAVLVPAAAQVRMLQVQPAARPAVQSPSVAVDYQAQYRQEVEKNKALRAQNASLKAQLDAYTSRTGSRVSAYCERATLSRNTAGASNDCSSNGFRCEPVSGLCRTVAHSSDECAAGYVYCSVHGNCVRSAQECQSGD